MQIAGAATECWVVTGGEGYVGAGLAAPGCLLAAPPPPGHPPPWPSAPPPGARARPPAGSLLCRYIHIRNGGFYIMLFVSSNNNKTLSTITMPRLRSLCPAPPPAGPPPPPPTAALMPPHRGHQPRPRLLAQDSHTYTRQKYF